MSVVVKSYLHVQKEVCPGSLMPNQGFKTKSKESPAVTLIYCQGSILFPWSPGVMLWSHLARKQQYWISVVSAEFEPSNSCIRIPF